MKITITTSKDDVIDLKTQKYTKSLTDSGEVTYTYDLDDTNKDSTIRMLADKLGVDMHDSSQCMTKLYTKISELDNPSPELKSSYNNLMITLEENGL